MIPEYIKSVVDTLEIAKDAGRVILAQTIGRVDTYLANKINGGDDES